MRAIVSRSYITDYIYSVLARLYKIYGYIDHCFSIYIYLDRENFAWVHILLIMLYAEKWSSRQMAESYQQKNLIGKMLTN